MELTLPGRKEIWERKRNGADFPADTSALCLSFPFCKKGPVQPSLPRDECCWDGLMAAAQIPSLFPNLRQGEASACPPFLVQASSRHSPLPAETPARAVAQGTQALCSFEAKGSRGAGQAGREMLDDDCRSSQGGYQAWYILTNPPGWDASSLPSSIISASSWERLSGSLQHPPLLPGFHSP